ncbi:MAG: TonB-dependent siderophore receptor, partial [bacterium]
MPDGQLPPVPRNRNFGEPSDFAKQDEVLVALEWSHAFTENWTLRHRFNADFLDINDLGTFSSFNLFNPEDLGLDPAILAGLDPNRTLLRFRQEFVSHGELYYNTLDLTGKLETWGLDHTLLLGGDYLYEPTDGGSPGFSILPPTDLFNPTHGDAPILTSGDFFGNDTAEKWHGFYVQDQVQLPYNLHLLAGFRYDHASIDRTAPGFEVSATEERVTPRYALLWRPRSELSFYGSYTEGFAGTTLGRITRSFDNIGAETAEQWELGAKTELFDGHLTGSVAYFQLTKDNIAVTDPSDFPLFR